MSTYVIGDIHGCYDRFQDMIRNIIRLSDSDTLYMVGDYIDRGDQSVEMMRWLEHLPDNILPVLGNHDANFAYYVYLMKQADAMSDDYITDPDSNEDTIELYFDTQNKLEKIDRWAVGYFDMYKTLTETGFFEEFNLKNVPLWILEGTRKSLAPSGVDFISIGVSSSIKPFSSK